ncbi:hypothetical protein J6590_030413 [Homalodisca vitripennis]|nr:hypothetical protein J6590_030413 [Homalodisca vitripennis]
MLGGQTALVDDWAADNRLEGNGQCNGLNTLMCWPNSGRPAQRHYHGDDCYLEPVTETCCNEGLDPTLGESRGLASIKTVTQQNCPDRPVKNVGEGEGASGPNTLTALLTQSSRLHWKWLSPEWVLLTSVIEWPSNIVANIDTWFHHRTWTWLSPQIPQPHPSHQARVRP